MNASDRWQHVEALYHAALARDETERAAFVREACGEDEPVRVEVESLLSYEAGAHAFLVSPAVESLPVVAPAERLTAGRRFGPYEIVSFIGAGGMGDVYRARDTKLGRDVAIKILPDACAADPGHRARLEREARVLASLNHPHIAAIHGFEDRDGLFGLVLELVEGRTLAERIREDRLPISEGLALARQIVDALHAAHAKDVIHRDLKPANIALTPDGAAKVLDFGLAKSAVETWDGQHAARLASIADSVAHAIVGTAAYMSPEQARGLAVDKRTDVWSFGCVLWAMLTGRPPFVSETVSGTLKAILEDDPDWRVLPTTAPAGIVQLLQRCLAKDPAARLSDIVDARDALDTALAAAAPATRASTRRIGRWQAAGLATAVVGLVISLGVLIASRSPVRQAGSRADIAFTQLTNFTDSAIQPALSPDGRILAFIRGSRPFLSTDPIYVKQLPDGEAELLASDPRSKYGIAFSPDGSELAYTVQGKGMHTYVMPVRGGEPRLFLANAAGLTWLDRHRLLFSAVKTGFHMGIVSAGVTGENRRDLYFPQHERSMAHYSFPSPDRRWALVVEMDPRPVWEPCRLIALDGSAPVRLVGPTGRCGSAGWSPDGTWMFFSVEVDDASHLWRQRFPDGRPEQITFGPTEEDGVAVAPDGSLVTSIGMAQSAIWVRDSRGERPLSSEGDVMGRLGSYSLPSFTRDGTKLYYLRRESPRAAPELWRSELASLASEPLLPGVGMTEYDVTDDGRRVVYTAQPSGKPSELWIAPLDGSSPPIQLTAGGENSPHFGPDGEVLFRFTDGRFNYLGRIDADGSARAKVADDPIGTVQAISPDRRWVTVLRPQGSASIVGSMAIPTRGGAARLICPDPCYGRWTPDGKVMYVQLRESTSSSPGQMIAMPVVPETGLPDLPPAGIQPTTPVADVRGSWLVSRMNVVPGLDPETYAYVKTTVHRNLFRLPAP